MEVRDGAGQDDDGVAHPLDAAKKFESLLVQNGNQDVFHVRVRIQKSPDKNVLKSIKLLSIFLFYWLLLHLSPTGNLKNKFQSRVISLF